MFSYFQSSAAVRQSKAAFSLIELLSVIAILGLLMGATVPSLLNSQRASALTQGGNLMADTATMARQTALSRNVITALIVATKTSDIDKQAVTILEYDPITKSWKQACQWFRLPEAVETTERDAGDNKKVDSSPATSIAAVNLKLNGQQLGSSDYTALVFYPDGRMDNSADKRKLSVKATGGDQTTNYYDLVFNSDTSSFRILRP